MVGSDRISNIVIFYLQFFAVADMLVMESMRMMAGLILRRDRFACIISLPLYFIVYSEFFCFW